MITIKKPFSFSLIELLMVVAIIAVIGTIAVSSYTNNIIKSQVATMFHDVEAAKHAVEGDFYRVNDYTNSTYSAGSRDFTTPNNTNVSSISVSSGVVTIQGNSNNFYGKNIWISWTPSIVSNDLVWTCSYSSDAANYIVSSSCQ
jgi:prepilin-type N-terminal cleavage/methylation domain-containing protein